MGKHRKPRQRTPSMLLVALLTGGMIAASGAAVADSPRFDSPQDALAALDEAQEKIDRVREYLRSLDKPPAPTPAPTTTAAPPPTTTHPTPAPPPPTNTKSPTAAARFGWGTPLAQSDEFDGSALNTAKWSVPNGCWDGHNGNGRRCAKNVTVQDGVLRLTGEANGDTGWVRHRLDQQHGRWEARVRTANTGRSGGLYHSLLLLWPTSGKRQQDGEYDFLETRDPDANCAGHFIHYPHPGTSKVQQEGGWEETCPVDMNVWHNFAMEWTGDHVRGFIDGEQVFSYSGGANSVRRAIQDMPSGHLNVQLDNFTGDGGLRPAVLEVDWVRVYEPS